MSIHDLEDVRQAIVLEKKSYFGSLKAYFTGFEAVNEFPRIFFYRACQEDNGYGLQCCKSLERGPCRDHPCGEESGYMFRFDLYLVDETISPTSPPLRVTVFDVAAALLKVVADQLHLMTELEQFQHVHMATQKLSMIYVYLSVNPAKDSFPNVEMLSHEKLGPFLPGHRKVTSSPRAAVSPRQFSRAGYSPRAVVTPNQSRRLSSKEDMASMSGPASTSQRDAAAQNEELQNLLFNVVEVLGRSNLGDK